MPRLYLLLFLLACLCLGYSQNPVKIIFDTDMGSDCDDAGALALLHAYADEEKAEILACVYSSGKVPYGAGVIEAINRYYGHAEIPVGAYHNDDVGDPVDKMGTEKLAKDTAAYGTSIIHNRDATEQTQLLRKLLSKQEDSSVTYLTVGHTKGLYDLLISEPDSTSALTGYDLVKKKIKCWVALGALGANNEAQEFRRDWNFFFNGTASYTIYLVENLPVPIFYIDAGTDVLTGQSLKATPPGNIVRIAYRDWLWNVEKKILDDQRPSWDLAAVYFAVEGIGAFLSPAATGRLECKTEGCRWEKTDSTSSQQFIVQKEGVSKQFADYLNDMLARPPTLK